MNPTEIDRCDIQRVITQQLDALGSRDGARALSYSSPARQQYGSGQRFLEVVQAGFPQLLRARRTDFGPLRLMHGYWTQQVTLTSTDGSRVPLLYVMEQQADGSWRIDQCVKMKERPPVQTPAAAQYVN